MNVYVFVQNVGKCKNMSMARRIKHKVKNQVWVRPEIGYDAWQKLNTYAKENNMDFPSAVDKAVDSLTGNVV